MTDFVVALTGTLQAPGSGNAAALRGAVTANVNRATDDDAKNGTGDNPTTPALVAKQIDALRANVTKVTAATYDPSLADNGKFKVLTDAAGVGCVLPNDMPSGFSATYIQGGAGQITFSAEIGGTMLQADNFTHSRKKGSAVTVLVLSNTGTAAEWSLFGDMEA